MLLYFSYLVLFIENNNNNNNSTKFTNKNIMYCKILFKMVFLYIERWHFYLKYMLIAVFQRKQAMLLEAQVKKKPMTEYYIYIYMFLEFEECLFFWYNRNIYYMCCILNLYLKFYTINMVEKNTSLET